MMSFYEWWDRFTQEHEDWNYVDSELLRKAAWHARDGEIAALTKSLNAAKAVISAQEQRISAKTTRLDELAGAESTLASEREANEKLTAEIAGLNRKYNALVDRILKGTYFNHIDDYLKAMEDYRKSEGGEAL